jgi:hypothetical protein
MSGGFGKFVTTPLWDYNKLLKRIVSKQDYMPAKKEDDGNPVILFLCDTSGSCRDISEESTKVAHSASVLGVRGADVWVVFHDDLEAVTDNAMHNGKAIEPELKRRIDKLKEHVNMTQDILAVVRPQLVVSITDMDSIKMNMDVLALGRWRTLILDTNVGNHGRKMPTTDVGLFYTIDALIRTNQCVGTSSYCTEKYRMEDHLYGRETVSYASRHHNIYFPTKETLEKAIILANRHLLFSFHNASIAAICASIDAYASPDRLARLTVR